MPPVRRKKAADTAVALDVEVVCTESPKKKTKKPIKIVAVVTPNGIEGTFSPEPRRPLIAHLQIHSNQIVFNETSVEPEPYNPSNLFAGDQESIQVEKTEPVPVKTIYSENTASEGRPLQCYAKIQLMVQYKDVQKTKVLPAKTDIACFWCVHPFEGQPCIIPEREVGGVFNVYGNFCCPQCALAYVLNETIDPHVRWERIALLHRIYDKEGRGRMFPAAARESLDIFGGPLSIESYRATVAQGKVRVDSHMPPMVSILGSIDTKPIDFFDSSMKNTLMGNLQMEKTTKAEEGLRLKRSKPLKDRESTLDSVMTIQLKGGREQAGQEC